MHVAGDCTNNFLTFNRPGPSYVLASSNAVPSSVPLHDSYAKNNFRESALRSIFRGTTSEGIMGYNPRTM